MYPKRYFALFRIQAAFKAFPGLDNVVSIFEPPGALWTIGTNSLATRVIPLHIVESVPLGCMFQEYHHESCKPRVIASVHKYLSPTMPPMPFFNVTMVDVGAGVAGAAGVGGAVGM